MPGPISLAVAVSAPVAGASAPPPAEGQEPDPNKPETRLVVVGDSDFAANSVAGHGRQPRHVPEHRQLARAAGEPDLGPAAEPRGSPHHADRRSGPMIFWFTHGDPARADLPRRHPDLVAEAIGCAACVVSDPPCRLRRPRRVSVLRRIEARSGGRRQEGQGLHGRVRQDRRARRQVGVGRTHDAQEDRQRLADRRARRRRQPDGAAVSGLTSNLSIARDAARHRREPADLGEYGLTQPRIEVTFKAGGKEQHAADRPQDAGRRPTSTPSSPIRSGSS